MHFQAASAPARPCTHPGSARLKSSSPPSSAKSSLPNDFTDLDQVQDRLTAFERRYNQTARPFNWKFTASDLRELPARIEWHEQKDRKAPLLPPAA